METVKSKVLVCCHKRGDFPNQHPYLPIQVGKANALEDLGIQGDDTGDNISAKNANYCELTGMYWAWKNLKNVDVIGLCHYRRYFDFHNQVRCGFPHTSFPSEAFDKLDLDIPDSIIRKVCSGSIIVAKPMNYRCSLRTTYCEHHYSDDFRKLEKVIEETQSEDVKKAFFKTMYQNNKFHHYNMFLMRWAEFDCMCSWLFPILEKVEQRTNISNYTVTQKRIFGYLSEYLINVWFYINRKSVKKFPILYINDIYDQLSHYSWLKYKVRCFINNFSFSLVKPNM